MGRDPEERLARDLEPALVSSLVRLLLQTREGNAVLRLTILQSDHCGCEKDFVHIKVGCWQRWGCYAAPILASNLEWFLPRQTSRRRVDSAVCGYFWLSIRGDDIEIPSMFGERIFQGFARFQSDSGVAQISPGQTDNWYTYPLLPPTVRRSPVRQAHLKLCSHTRGVTQ